MALKQLLSNDGEHLRTGTTQSLNGELLYMMMLLLFITPCTIIHSPFLRLNNQNIKSTDKTVTIITLSKNKVSLTYKVRETTFTTNMLKYENLKTAFKTKNSKRYNLRPPPKKKLY
jgi:hypothetical protein